MNNSSAPTLTGNDATQFFFELTPEKILDAVETLGFRCTGRSLALNSMENRVYEVELDLDEPPRNPSEKFRIVKFYRPGRWSEEQIAEEHQFLAELAGYELPVVSPIASEEGQTIFREQTSGIMYSVFPKVGGRSPDELDDAQLLQIGRLLGRMHKIGITREAPHRIICGPDNLANQGLLILKDSGLVPAGFAARLFPLAEEIIELITPMFEDVPIQRIHGDCHLRNLIWGREGLTVVDFDDMMRGPCVQDLWLLIPGRDSASAKQLNLLLEGYEQMCAFDRSTLSLIEPLRAMRIIHFAGWIAKRFADPAFPAAFPDFASDRYWAELIEQLDEQLKYIRAGGNAMNPIQEEESEEVVMAPWEVD